MADTYIDTTLVAVGNGSFATPYNYFDVAMLTNQNRIFITSTSILKTISIKNATALGCSLIGYDPLVSTEAFAVDEFPDETMGPKINAADGEYCINFNTLTSIDPYLILKNLQLLNWTVNPLSVDLTEVDSENLTTMSLDSYAKGWKLVTIKTI